MTIALYGTATVNSDSSGRNSFGFNHDNGSGLDRLLLVSAKIFDSASNKDVATLTCNGVSLTKITGASEDNNYGSTNWIDVEWWYLINPPAGVQPIAGTYSGTHDRADAVTAFTLTGVDQSTPIGATNKATGAGTDISLSLMTTRANSWVVGGTAKRYSNGGVFSPGTDVVELTDGNTGTASAADFLYTDIYKIAASTGSYTLNTSNTGTGSGNSQWVYGLFEILEALPDLGGHAGPLVNARRLRSKLRGLV